MQDWASYSIFPRRRVKARIRLWRLLRNLFGGSVVALSSAMIISADTMVLSWYDYPVPWLLDIGRCLSWA